MKTSRHLLPAFIAGLILVTAPISRAADTAPSTPPAAEKAKGDKPSNEALTPEERAKRRKEAAEKRAAQLKELRAKKEAGALAESEKATLERLEKQAERSKNARKNKGQGGPDGQGKGKRKREGGDKPAA